MCPADYPAVLAAYLAICRVDQGFYQADQAVCRVDQELCQADLAV